LQKIFAKTIQTAGNLGPAGSAGWRWYFVVQGNRSATGDEAARQEALEAFSGVDRRFQVRGKERGIAVVDDYGHHPTEIRATLDGARLCGFERIHVLFQPHRFSRTFHLMNEFGRAFHQADSVFVLDIYAASEQPIEGVTAEALVERIRQFGHRSAEYVGTIARGVDALVAVARPGDLVLTLGAGSVWQAGEAVLERLRGEAGHGA